MEIRENGVRYKKFKKWGVPPDTIYDYASEGVVPHLFSNKIVKNQNNVLQILLRFFDNSIIFLLQYVDELKYFKDFHSKNR